MRKATLTFVIVLLGVFLVFASGCTQKDNVDTNVTLVQKTEAPEIYCGDGACDTNETCNCADCVGDSKCSDFANVCNDNNNCTTDVFDKVSESCEHISKETCCGDGRCEDAERCEVSTDKTVCQEDCGYTCPSRLVVHKEGNINEIYFTISCLGDCAEIATNRFQAKGDVQFFTIIENFGEKASSQVSFNTFCSSEGRSIKSDGLLNGVNLNFYFNDYEELLRYISGNVRDQQNYATYWIAFKPVDLKGATEFSCNVDINSFGLNQTEKFFVTYLVE